MSLYTSAKEGSNIPVIEAGSYPAVCYGIVDLGMQYSEIYQKSSPKVIVMWEIPSEKIEVNGQKVSRTITQTYTNSLNEKAILRKDLAAWRGRDFTPEELNKFNLASIVGTHCLLNIIHRENGGRTYANVGAIMKMPKGMDKPAATLDQIIFDLDESDLSMLDNIPEWITKRIKESETYKERIAGKGDTLGDDSIDDERFIEELDDEDGNLPF